MHRVQVTAAVFVVGWERTRIEITVATVRSAFQSRTKGDSAPIDHTLVGQERARAREREDPHTKIQTQFAPLHMLWIFAFLRSGFIFGLSPFV